MKIKKKLPSETTLSLIFKLQNLHKKNKKISILKVLNRKISVKNSTLI